MSLRVLNMVWRATLPTGTQKLVAARLAAFADDGGGRVFPSNARVARDCAISDRTVRDAIRCLLAINVLILVAEERPGQYRPREYRFNLDELAARDETPNMPEAQEDTEGGSSFRAEAASGRNDVPPSPPHREEAPSPLCAQEGGSSFPPVPSEGGTSFLPLPIEGGSSFRRGGKELPPDPLLEPLRVSVVETRVGATSAAKAIIRAFDAARGAAYGDEHRRPFPHAKDIVFAQRWLSAGADVELCEGVFTAACHTMAERSQAPPAALAFFDQPIADAIATRNRPMPEGLPHAHSDQRPRRETATETTARRRAGMADALARRMGSS